MPEAGRQACPGSNRVTSQTLSAKTTSFMFAFAHISKKQTCHASPLKHRRFWIEEDYLIVICKQKLTGIRQSVIHGPWHSSNTAVYQRKLVLTSTSHFESVWTRIIPWWKTVEINLCRFFIQIILILLLHAQFVSDLPCFTVTLETHWPWWKQLDCWNHHALLRHHYAVVKQAWDIKKGSLLPY